MEDSRLSYKMKQELSFTPSQNLFLQIFKDHNQDSSDLLTEGNSWFLAQNIENDEKNDIFNNPLTSEKSLMEISCLGNIENIFMMIFKRNCNKPIENFINDLVDTLFEIHLEIKEREAKTDKNQKTIDELNKNLTEIEAFIAKSKNQSIYEDFLSVNYVKDKSYCSELFKYYKLKYKAGIASDKMISIFSEEDIVNKSCIIPISETENTIKINIYGKKTHHKENEFKILSEISLPLMEIYSSIENGSFLNEKIPPVYLILEFKDQSEHAEYDGFNKFELRFDLKIGLKKRCEIIKILMEHYTNENIYYKESIKRRIVLVETLLSPFKNDIYYDIDAGLISKRKTKKPGICDINCLIY